LYLIKGTWLLRDLTWIACLDRKASEIDRDICAAFATVDTCYNTWHALLERDKQYMGKAIKTASAPVDLMCQASWKADLTKLMLFL